MLSDRPNASIGMRLRDTSLPTLAENLVPVVVFPRGVLASALVRITALVVAGVVGVFVVFLSVFFIGVRKNLDFGKSAEVVRPRLPAVVVDAVLVVVARSPALLLWWY